MILGEIPHATSGGSTFEQLTTTNTLGVAAGIQVTKAGGQIAIEDPSNHAIYTYNPPSGGSLGAPAEITSLGGSGAPVAFAFTNNMTHLYTADEASSSLLKYDYPAGDSTPVLGVLLGGAPFGTAVVPAQP